jgi:protoporphyrin/coproporphyrin ferrochelatase
VGIASPHKGILLLGFGGPDSLDDVGPFLEHVLSGRPLPPDLVHEVRARYRHIGGRSPLLEITRRQASALEQELLRAGAEVPVYIGMRHWRPFISETLPRMSKEGVTGALCVIMSPYQSPAAADHYREAVEEEVKERAPAMKAQFVSSWHVEPLYLDAVAESVQQGLARFPNSRRGSVSIVFTGHSLPLRAVAQDAYVEHLRATIAGIRERVGDYECDLAFQSRGRAAADWLSPGVEETIEALAAQGKDHVLVVPLGFVSDHLETLYDLDIVVQGKANALGVTYRRAPALNDSPRFIAALAHVVLHSLCRK